MWPNWKINFYNLNLLKSTLPGIFFISVIVTISIVISSYVLIGSVAIAIIIGMLIKQFFPINETFNDGIKFSEKILLSIVELKFESEFDRLKGSLKTFTLRELRIYI